MQIKKKKLEKQNKVQVFHLSGTELVSGIEEKTNSDITSGLERSSCRTIHFSNKKFD